MSTSIVSVSYAFHPMVIGAPHDLPVMKFMRFCYHWNSDLVVREMIFHLHCRIVAKDNRIFLNANSVEYNFLRYT
jgi:hypothetical protein